MKNLLKKQQREPEPPAFAPLCAKCKGPANVAYRRSWETPHIGVTYQFYCDEDYRKVLEKVQKGAKDG